MHILSLWSVGQKAGQVKIVIFAFLYRPQKMWNIAIIVIVLISSTRILADNIGDPISSKNVVALVLARGGSKGIPLKNLAILNNETLLTRTLRTIKASGAFQDIYVSTDHDLIAKEAETNNVSVHRRSEEYSRDNTSSIESVVEFLQHHPEIMQLALIQCTSPFTEPDYLKAAKDQFDLAECVFSAERSHKLRWRFNGIERGVTPLNFDPAKRPRRQDWKGELVENGMFYFASRRLIMEFNAFQGKFCAVVEVPAKHSLEIDSPFDLKLAEMIIKYRKEEGA